MHSAQPDVLEGLSHYDTEPAAEKLAGKDALAAAKLYRALGLRILQARKSRYYNAALAHFERARDLYLGAGQHSEWKTLADAVRKEHPRKSGFLSGFEQLVSGNAGRSESFAEQAREQWKRLTS